MGEHYKLEGINEPNRNYINYHFPFLCQGDTVIWVQETMVEVISGKTTRNVPSFHYIFKAYRPVVSLLNLKSNLHAGNTNQVLH